MRESYASKRERWQKQLAALPLALRGHISLRNVESVSALPPQAQATLAQAIQAGLKRLPHTVEILSATPHISVDALFEKINAAQDELECAAAEASLLAAREQLADLIQHCYPDMPRLSAEALSGAGALSEVRQIVSSQAALFASPHFHSDFVMVIFHACLVQALDRLELKLAENPAFKQAVLKSGCNHQPLEGSNA